MTGNQIDEALLDALKTSTQHRVLLLALEAQLTAFIQTNLDLPVLETNRLNGFQRLLAHKLGDYYFVDHTLDRARGLIMFSRLPHSKVPEKTLMTLWQDAQREQADASGVSLAQQPKMRIMRRTDASHSSPATPRQASPAPSSAQSKDQEAKDKETRYNLARARIFKDFEPEAASATTSPQLAADDFPRQAFSDKGTRSSPGGRLQSRPFKARKAVPDPEYSRTLIPPAWSQGLSQGQSAQHAPSLDESPSFLEDNLQDRHAQYQNQAPANSDRLADALARGVPEFQMPTNTGGTNGRTISALPVPPRSPAGNIWQYKSTIPLSSANLAALEASTQQVDQSFRNLWLQPPRPE
ncbi:hypothetical protein BCR37DRAFT_392465 [Protomyces lactucae-debilis]|uniref:SUZ domain-containing protein n=1 Tax=Protomyces lactucae-debilis TaxID=2754530 RepID=A0A1Y2FHM1_PROLT|nr:uncharacterized protein BCR37DRAFT_392465 [Protomyces lactucae-debilis]ORY83107.1 hypothetical protein BCR37DRAFT_392465 [Protomyces lactucae-debilis]